MDIIYYETITSFNQTLEGEVYPALKEFVDEAYLQLQLVEDMDPSSQFLANLNSSPRTPLHTIAGAEDPWQLFRLMGTAINGDDMSLIKTGGAIRQLQSFIISVINIHNCVYDGSKWVAILMPWVWITRESVNTSRRNWEDLQRLLEIDIHTKWAELIGAYHYEDIVITVPIYDASTDTGGDMPGSGNGGGNQGVVGEVGGIIGYKQEVHTVRINDEHDGLIGTASALYETPNAGVKVHVVQGVNHMEMATNPSMIQYVLNAIAEIEDAGPYLPGIVVGPGTND